MKNTPKNIIKLIADQEIEFVDFRFTDTKGKWHHTAQTANSISEKLLEEGVMFDGSSIAGWKDINESDMILKPDLDSAVQDPFTAQPSLIIYCDVLEPKDGSAYNRDPRSIAKKAVEYLKEQGIGDQAFFGPELEFFVFDDVKYQNDQHRTFYELDQEEGSYTSAKDYPTNNMGHRPGDKGGYFPCAPVDTMVDMRAEMLTVLQDVGIPAEKHHHEVAPSQQELGFEVGHLLQQADRIQLYKYVVRNVAHSYGKTATFMPKPKVGDNGSGMHVHQSIWQGDTPLFAGDGYAGLSETALYYTGGIIKHARAINAFSNSSTNSYKRLVPGFEAPTMLAYSALNRSASIRIPFGYGEATKRIEARFPDSSGNPYLTFVAMLLAGIDGIKNKIHPGEPTHKDLYALSEEEAKGVPTVCSSLRQALEALDADREFLTSTGVMDNDFIDSYIALKIDEVKEFEQATHPIEFKLYYSC